MPDAPDCDVSVIIPFADDEERVGALSSRIAAHLRALGLRFEVLVVDEESGDNSVALLSLLRTDVRELRILCALPRQGFAAGARHARGRVLWMFDVQRATAPLAPFSRAYGRVIGGDADAIVVAGRYLVCRRARAWRVAVSVRGRARVHERRFLGAARRQGLAVEAPAAPVVPPLARLLSGLVDFIPRRE